MMADTVVVCEVGPRDGLQMSRSRMATAAKVRPPGCRRSRSAASSRRV